MLDFITGFEDPEIRNKAFRVYLVFVASAFALVVLSVALGYIFSSEFRSDASLSSMFASVFMIPILGGYSAWPFGVYRHCPDPISTRTAIGLPMMLGTLFGPLMLVVMLTMSPVEQEASLSLIELFLVPLFFSAVGPLMMGFMSSAALFSLRVALKGKLRVAAPNPDN